MKPPKYLSLKAKLILAQIAMSDNPVKSMCFFRENADLFEREGGVSLIELAETYHLAVQSVWEHTVRLIEIGAIVRLKRGRYGLPETLADAELNLVVMEYGENTA